MLLDLVPLVVVLSVSLSSIREPYFNSEDIHNGKIQDRLHDLWTAMEVVSIFCLWAKAFYFLRIWTETAYIAKMVVQVLEDMQVFFLITLIAHSGLG